MNTKKIMGAVCAAVCVANFSIMTPAQAFGTPSAAQQEAWARESIQKHFNTSYPAGDSSKARTMTPIVRALQKRICDVNGIEITEQPYQHGSDYKKKIHPISVVDNYSGGYSAGGGYIFIGAGDYSENELLSPNSWSSYLQTEMVIAHELGHNTFGEFWSVFKAKSTEKQADKDGIKFLESLPEGGLGAYLLHRKWNTDTESVYWKAANSIRKSFEKATDGKISIESDGRVVKYQKGNDWYMLTTVTRNLSQAGDANTYYGGQMAYCIAKKALTVDSIDIIPNNLKDTLKFQGDYLLICRSNRFPNGYRILAPLYGTEEALRNTMNIFINGDYVNIKNFKDAAKKTSQEGNDVYTNSIWTMWVTYAVAKDLAQ